MTNATRDPSDEQPSEQPHSEVRLNAHERRMVAVAAVSSERTVESLYAGKPVRETSAIRLLKAIDELLEQTKHRPASFAEILATLRKATGRCEASFASKLLPQSSRTCQ